MGACQLIRLEVQRKEACDEPWRYLFKRGLRRRRGRELEDARLHDKKGILENCEHIASCIKGLKAGLPGLDLVVFPEYSTHGIMYDFDEMMANATTVDGPEVAIFKKVCIENHAWGVFSLTGERHEEHPKKSPTTP